MAMSLRGRLAQITGFQSPFAPLEFAERGQRTAPFSAATLRTAVLHGPQMAGISRDLSRKNAAVGRAALTFADQALSRVSARDQT
jgi:hypothetical protein